MNETTTFTVLIETKDEDFKTYLSELLKEMQDHEEIDSFEVKEEEE